MTDLVETRLPESRRPSVEIPASGQLPVVAGFYSDPTICRVDDTYYLVHSSFEYFPGAPIFESRDLVTWTQIGHVLTRRSQFELGEPRPSSGIYGSTLRHHGGRFWYITTNVSRVNSGQLLVSAESASGPWSEPLFIPDAVGIDPDLCWVGDECYLTWKELRFGAGEFGIRQAKLDLETGELGEVSLIWEGTGLGAVEGPHLYEIDGVWYLLVAEGGTERGHCVSIARGPTPAGPFEGCPDNPILTHRSTMVPVQSVGHADLVQNRDGSWAAVYLGTRPRGSTPGFHTNGRETFVAGVNWYDGWPVFDERRYVPVETDTSWDDDFSGPSLDFRWVSPSSEPDTVTERIGGGVRIVPTADGGEGLLCARVRDESWTAEAVVEDSGRFLVRLDDRHWYGVDLSDLVARAIVRIGDIEHEVASANVTGPNVVLWIESVAASSPSIPLGHGGPDDIVIGIDEGDRRHELARLDGRYVSTEVAGGFTGRMLALSSIANGGIVRRVRYRPRFNTSDRRPQ